MKYTKKDIFQMLIDSYNFQAVFDPEVDKEIDVSCNTSIEEWISICDLVRPEKLAKFYYHSFELKSDYSKLEYILLNGDKYNLGDLCQYIADSAIKREINPIVLFGKKCKSAAIFKTLKLELNKRGINTDNLKPSSEILPFFLKYGGVLVDVVSRIAPGSLTNFEYEENRPTSVGTSLIILTLLLMVPTLIFWNFHWIFISPIVLGLILAIVGRNLEPKKCSVGFNSFRELIYEMERKLENKSLVE